MKRLLAFMLLALFMIGLIGSVYSAYASSQGYSILSEDEDDDHDEGSGSGGGSSDSPGDSDDDEEEAVEEHEEFMEEYYSELEDLNELKYKVDMLNSSGYNVSAIYPLLEQAEANLTMALQEYQAGNLGAAWSYLKNADKLLDVVEDSIKQLVKKGKVMSVVSYEDEEDEDDDYIEYSIVDGNITVSSEDNKVEFGERPKIEFEYTRNNTEVSFSVEDFVFIEFIDENGNGRIDEGEVLQRVSSKDLIWTRNFTTNTFDNNTEIVITYYTNMSGYEIELVMHIYKYNVIANTSLGNKTVTLVVDGGADQVKYDFIVYSWPWMSNQSYLALFNEVDVSVEKGAALKSINADDDMISVDLDSVEIVVSWIKFATVDGAPVNVSAYYESLEVEASSGEASVELKVFFVYPNFGSGILVHDPSIGVLKEFAASILPPLINLDVLVLFGVFALVIAAVATLLVRKGYIASVI